MRTRCVLAYRLRLCVVALLSPVASRTTNPVATVGGDPINRDVHAGTSTGNPTGDPVLGKLQASFGRSFVVLDLDRAQLEQVADDALPIDLFSRVTLCEEVARRGKPEIIEEHSPLLVLAVPLVGEDGQCDRLAITTFLTKPVSQSEELSTASELLGIDPGKTFAWSQKQEVWPARAAIELANAIAHSVNVEAQLEATKRQSADVSSSLLSTFDELSLMHRLTAHLSLDYDEANLGQLVTTWLREVLPIENATLLLALDDGVHHNGINTELSVITDQPGPIADKELPQLIERLGPEASDRSVVLNRTQTDSPTWYYPTVREVVSVPIRVDDRRLGWLLVFNCQPNHASTRTDYEGFGHVEASLLTSVASILGVHARNSELFKEREEFFGSVIRALSSAIDAKDPYTRGHSERVARLAVCIGSELGCDPDELNTLYLSGLLHDIGKIGVDDKVLRKPGDLTSEEFEHIKQHPELGHKILAGVRQLDHVLPVVLHHHEAWDGSGYPGGLRGCQCPRLARIVAVADAIDAMASDRPYRAGMSDEKLDQILQSGRDRQWDPEVIDAVFRVRDKIQAIGGAERSSLSLDVRDWSL